MSKKPQKKNARPERKPAGGNPSGFKSTSGAPPEVVAAAQGLKQFAESHPEGWGAVAQAIRELPEIEADVMFQFLALNLGKEVLPLLRGAALDEDEPLALAALGALPLMGTRAAGDVLAEAYSAYPDGERARAAWQGVEALQARGINVSVPAPEGARPVVPTHQLRDLLESVPDGVGSRQLFARFQDRYGVWSSVAVVWNDTAGVKEGFHAPMSRAEFADVRAWYEGQHVLLAPIPVEYARWQVDQARGLNAQSGFPLGEHLSGWDQFFPPAPVDYTPDGIPAALLELDEEALDSVASHVHHLWEDASFQSWAWEPADLRPWLERWQALEERLYGSEEDEAAEVEMADLLAEAVNGVFTPQGVSQWRERLLDTARKLNWLGRDHEAGAVAACALLIDRAEQPGDSEFLRDLAYNGLEALNNMLEEGEDPEAMRYDPMLPPDAYADDEPDAE